MITEKIKESIREDFNRFKKDFNELDLNTDLLEYIIEIFSDELKTRKKKDKVEKAYTSRDVIISIKDLDRVVHVYCPGCKKFNKINLKFLR